MRSHSPTPVPESEYDLGGRFTKSPHHDIHCLRDSSLVSSSVYALILGWAAAERALGAVDGSDPTV